MISNYDYLVNDETNMSDCQYNMYCDTLTMMQKNADRSVAQDTRQAAVTIKIQLQAPYRLPANKDLMINNFDIQQLAIHNENNPQ